MLTFPERFGNCWQIDGEWFMMRDMYRSEDTIYRLKDTVVDG